jgi:hypothetical protein
MCAVGLVGCGEKESQPKQTTNAPTASSPLTAPVDYLGAVGKAKTFAEKTVDLAQLNQAIQMFVAQESRYPKSLDELKEAKLINEVPKAPYGMKIEYDANTGKVKVVKQ